MHPLLAGVGVRSDADGGEGGGEGSQPEAVVPVVGVQLHWILPSAVLRARPVEQGLPGHGEQARVQRGRGGRVHPAG